MQQLDEFQRVRGPVCAERSGQPPTQDAAAANPAAIFACQELLRRHDPSIAAARGAGQLPPGAGNTRNVDNSMEKWLHDVAARQRDAAGKK